jgi:hypothetical protein
MGEEARVTLVRCSVVVTVLIGEGGATTSPRNV